jgi:uncharacterized protein YcaQ
VALLTVSPTDVRRLAVTKQRLSGPRPPATAAGLMEVIRDLRCVQLDPTNAVAPTQLLVPWSRVGPYDTALLDDLLWKEKMLFHYWAHAASWVLTEDYPIHRREMRSYLTDDGAWTRRMRIWVEDNAELKRHILSELRRRGPLRSRDFEDRARVPWPSSGWTAGRNVGRMLDFLWARGDITIAGRDGMQRLWDLSSKWFPEWTPRQTMSQRRVVERAAQISLKALGVATRAQISEHFTRSRYPGLGRVLADFVRRGVIEEVSVVERGSAWPGPWYIHSEDVPLMEHLDEHWDPRTVLLSPFDNLICDRARTEQIFDFSYRIEIYVPKNKRRFGYFAMPVLHGDHFIARIDPFMKRKTATLRINAIHLEPSVRIDRQIARSLKETVLELGEFLGARSIEFDTFVPAELRPHGFALALDGSSGTTSRKGASRVDGRQGQEQGAGTQREGEAGRRRGDRRPSART